MTDAIFIYMTCATPEEAQKIASALLEKSLIACANILPPHTSVYRWQGEIQTAQETAIILKTRTALFKSVQEIVLSLHSYECPCLIALPIQAGNVPFLDWINAETAGNR